VNTTTSYAKPSLQFKTFRVIIDTDSKKIMEISPKVRSQTT